jgi:hypothetical protein
VGTASSSSFAVKLALAFSPALFAAALLPPSAPPEQAARARAPAPSSIVIRFIVLLLVRASKLRRMPHPDL